MFQRRRPVAAPAYGQPGAIGWEWGSLGATLAVDADRAGVDPMTVNGRILIVEDDPDVREMLAEYLRTHGYEVALADRGTAMREAVEKTLPDVVLLDVNLPGEDGFTLARFLRERYDVGIIMVTAATDVADRVTGLEVGADDYVAKPFDLRELRARVKSIIRRMQARPIAAPVPAPAMAAAASRVRVGACALDLASHQLFASDGSELPLTSMEFALLKVFLERPNQVLNRDQLLTLTRNREWEPFDRSIDIRIARLRRKIEQDPEHPQAIRTVRGEGYMFISPRHAS
jgi:two-component system phosphate regulon response regulator OmpR